MTWIKTRRLAAVWAALAHTAIILAVGAGFGTVRVLVLAPRLGPLGAVAVELPFMLLASFLTCGKIIDRVGVPRRWPDRIMMSALSLALLLSAEFLVAVFAVGRTAPAYMADFGTWAGALGLLVQLAFAAFPALRMDRGL